MKMSRFYQSSSLEIGEELQLSAANHRHAIQVLRLKENDMLILFDGIEGEYYARLVYVDRRKSKVVLESFSAVNCESQLHSMMYIAMIKPEKMDFAIQKMVELGVSIIQPMYTKRSIVKIKANRLEKKMQHWQGIIISACEQSGRTKIPIINQPKIIEECLKDTDSGSSFVMLPGEYSGILQQGKLDADKISLFIGPEGGFTAEEEKLLLEEGVKPISFGKRILRAETAAIASLTACQLKWGDLSTCQ